MPKTVAFRVDRAGEGDQYARLFAAEVVETLNSLTLPRYGLGNYVASRPAQPPTASEAKAIADLGRAGKRLMGFCRTNLFKRLESSGQAFLQSVERHIVRNYVVLHALEAGLPIPIGTQEAEGLDTRVVDEDVDLFGASIEAPDADENGEREAGDAVVEAAPSSDERAYRRRAAEVYAAYAGPLSRRFRWPAPALFTPQLAHDLRADAQALLGILAACGDWETLNDTKLNALVRLLTKLHPREKVLIFTQFADTVRYLEEQLVARGVAAAAGVTGRAGNPTALA